MNRERENLNQKIESLEDNNNALKKYQGIVDTEQKAKDILFKANLEASEIFRKRKKRIGKRSFKKLALLNQKLM